MAELTEKADAGVHTSSSIRKPGLWIGYVIASLLIVMSIGLFWISASSGERRTAGRKSSSGSQMTRENGAHNELPPLPPPRLGNKWIKCGELFEVPIKAGWKWHVKAVLPRGRDTVDYGVYINGVWDHHVGPNPPPGKTNEAGKQIFMDQDWKLGIKPTPGLGFEKIRIVIIMYMDDGQGEPKGWEDRALLVEDGG